MKKVIISVLVAVAMIFSVTACKTKKAAASEKVPVEFYVMSQCPFGVQVEKAIIPALDQLGDAVDFQLEFIGQEQTPGNLTSMHGQNEVKGDMLHLCAKKYAPETYLKLVECMNKNMREIPNNFNDCTKEAGIEAAKITACAEGDEGKQLLSASFKKAGTKNATGSPTIFINGKPYSGGRKTGDFMRAICAEYKSGKPAACSSIPEPKKVDLTVLTDARCKECNTAGIVNRLKMTFPGLQVKELDYGTPEGKTLYTTLKKDNVDLLPVFLFASNVKDDEGYQEIQRWLVDTGDYKMLRIGAKFDPTAEICDNKIDDNGDGKIDCDDPSCQEKLVCRAEKQGDLEVFVMSQCPYGVMALNAMKEVLDTFGDTVEFKINYIADEVSPGQFKSLHGQPEVDENIRELCAMKYYPKNHQYMDYILCRNKNIRSDDWKPCAKEAKMDVAKLEKCATSDEGKALHSENIKVAKGLGFGASPTWLANNRYQFSGITAEQIKENFCKYNKDKKYEKACAKTLSGNSGPAPKGGCGS